MYLDKSYSVRATRKFDKASKKLEPNLKKALDKKIKLLGTDPHYNSLNTKKIQVSETKLKQLEVDIVYEFYINKGYRCVFYVRHDKKEMLLAKIGNHDNVSKWFPK